MQTSVTEVEVKKREVTKVICLDWLEISFIKKLPVIALNKSHWLDERSCIVRTENNKRTYDGLYILQIDGIRIGELSFNSRFSFVPAEVVHLKIDNKLLYSDGCGKHIRYITNVLGFTYSHIKRIDIAIDSNDRDVISFMKKYMNSTKIRVKGKLKRINTITLGKASQTVYFGSSTSGKQIRIYNKIDEVLRSGKDYIFDFYTLNGLNHETAEVQRIELTLRTKFTKNIDIHRLSDANYLASICRTNFKNYFEFISEYREHNKTVIRNVTPVSFDGFTTTLLPRVAHTPAQSHKSLKMQLKSLYVNVLNEESIQSQPLQPDSLISESIEANVHFLAAIHRILLLKPTLMPYFRTNEKKWRKAAKNN